MNNDIAQDVNHYINIPKISKNTDKTTEAELCCNNVSSQKTTADSMGCLSAMGYAQVNMDNPFSKACVQAIEEFKQNPELVEAQIELQDELVKKGYTLEEAIIKSDSIFSILKQQDLYN